MLRVYSDTFALPLMPKGPRSIVDDPHARVGQQLRGKYKIDALLGVGGMAAVYAATHRNGRQVAVKVLHPRLSLKSDIRGRFLREGLAANAVKHPGVLEIIDDDTTDDGTAFLVMELLTGESVEELWERSGKRLPPRVALTIVADLCEILAAAHEAGVVHRDLKPANLFLTLDGRLKVLDFGLARLRDATAGLTATATGVVIGTPAFLPPEQAAGLTKQVDARTDIWAAGATLFTLLSGATVHQGATSHNLLVNAATKQARSLATVLPDAPPEIVAVVDRALSFEQDARWPNAAAMGAELRRVSTALFGDASDALVGLAKEVTPEHRREKERLPVIGGSTAQPDSSASLTEPRRDVGVAAKPASTARPVAATKAPPPTRRNRRGLFVALAGGALLLLLVGILVARRSAPPQVAHPAVVPSAEHLPDAAVR